MSIEENFFLVDIDELRKELEACASDEEFFKTASEQARATNLPISIVRAIGRGKLTHDRKESAAFIQSYLSEVSDDALERSRRTAWLAEFFGVPNQSISSTLAHKKIAKKRSPDRDLKQPKELKPVVKTTKKRVESVLTDLDRLDIFNYLSAAEGPEDRRLRNSEVAELYDIEVGSVPAVMANITRRIEAIRNTVLSNTDKVQVELVTVADELILEEAPHDMLGELVQSSLVEPEVADSSEGAKIEYDNEVKNKWRAEVSAVIEETIPLHKRSKMKVLCLPGKDWIEVSQIYLALGFKPENIYGIEREASVRGVFEETAGTLGCNSYFGDLEDFLAENSIDFDFVSLDFLGPLGPDKMRIIGALKLTKTSFVLVNHMAQRETKNTQEYYALNKDFHDQVNASLDPTRLTDQSDFKVAHTRDAESQRFIAGELMQVDATVLTRKKERALSLINQYVESGRLEDLLVFMAEKSVSGSSLFSKLDKGRPIAQAGQKFLNERDSIDLSSDLETLKKESGILVMALWKIIETALEGEVFESEGKILTSEQIAYFISLGFKNYMSGVKKNAQVQASWQYIARKNKFNSELVALNEPNKLANFSENRETKRFIEFCLELLELAVKANQIKHVKNNRRDFCLEDTETGEQVKVDSRALKGFLQRMSIVNKYFTLPLKERLIVD